MAAKMTGGEELRGGSKSIGRLSDESRHHVLTSNYSKSEQRFYQKQFKIFNGTKYKEKTVFARQRNTRTWHLVVVLNEQILLRSLIGKSEYTLNDTELWSSSVSTNDGKPVVSNHARSNNWGTSVHTTSHNRNL